MFEALIYWSDWTAPMQHTLFRGRGERPTSQQSPPRSPPRSQPLLGWLLACLLRTSRATTHHTQRPVRRTDRLSWCPMVAHNRKACISYDDNQVRPATFSHDHQSSYFAISPQIYRHIEKETYKACTHNNKAGDQTISEKLF